MTRCVGPRRGASDCGRGARAPQNPSEKFSRVRIFDFRNLLRCSTRHDFAASIAGFRTEIDDPISALEYFEIVLDYHDRMSVSNQPLKQLQQHRHVVEMQSRGWFVENQQIADCFTICALSVGRLLAIYRS